MIGSILASSGSDFTSPYLDWHALAPLAVLTATMVVALVIESIYAQRRSGLLPSVVGLGLLGSLIPVVTLALSDDASRPMFGGGFVVDRFALLMTAVFVVSGYITVLLSTHYIAEGDYDEGEYYILVLVAVIGMVFMASSRDLISIFVALELFSIPSYLLAAWRKRTRTGVEAGLKYYLIGVFATGVMLYGMSLIYGGTGETVLTSVGAKLSGDIGSSPMALIGIVMTLVAFAFKVSAVPFHHWAPDTYEGSPTPITAFFSVATKAAGFVALMQLIFVGFLGQANAVRPMMWVLAVLTMTVGNVIALRQTNVVRLFAYSSIAQAGFMLAPLAVVTADAGVLDGIRTSIVFYLVVYTLMNLGVFAVIIAVSRRTGTGEMSSWGGLFNYAPALAVTMSVFLFSLGGIPPMVGWLAKFRLFEGVLGAGTASGYVLAGFMAVNSVISMAYYLGLIRRMFIDDAVEGDHSAIKVPLPLAATIGVLAVAVVGLGMIPGPLSDMAKSATLAMVGG